MLCVTGLDVDIGHLQVLRGAHIRVAAQTTTALVGRNGAGKTTLMRTIMGLLNPRTGQMLLDGADLGSVAPHRRAHLGLGYMPEDRRLVPALSVEENIMLPVRATGMQAFEKRRRWIYGLIPEIAALAPRSALQLSGGQQKLAALSRALMCATRLLLLDEPFEGVAPVLAERLAEVVRRLKFEGVSVLVSASGYAHLVEFADHLYTIERGVVKRAETDGEPGPPRQATARPS